MAARDGVVYDEEHPSESIDAAWEGEVKDYSAAVKTDHDVSDFDDWVTLEIAGDRGTWYARHYGTTDDGHMGDMPGEAAIHVMYEIV